jgi:hypothetical protein
MARDDRAMSGIHARIFRVPALALALGCAGGGLAACDPCFGVSSCSDSGVIDYEGTIVNDAGAAAPGVQVRVTRMDGVELQQDTLAAITGSDGHFFLRGGARSTGTLFARVEVIPTGSQGFTVDSVPLEATRSGGTQFFGRWTTHAFVEYLVWVLYRANSRPLAGATVDFHRTGTAVANPDSRRVRTNGDGLFWIIADVDGDGPLTGRLDIRPAGSDTVLTVPEVRLPLLHAFGDTRFIQQWVGFTLAYTGRLIWSDTGEPADGVEVAFTRTGGLQVSRDTFTVQTDTSGIFHFDTQIVDPLRAGEVVGQLSVNPPAPYQPLAVEVRLPAFDADTTRLLGEWTLQRAP